MKRVKITVLKTEFHKDLAEKYANPELGLCDVHKPGQVFYTNGWEKPAGLCDNAWKSMIEYVFTLSHGGGDFFDGWMQDKKSAVVACNDGIRPVSFLLEATDEDAPVFENLEVIER